MVLYHEQQLCPYTVNIITKHYSNHGLARSNSILSNLSRTKTSTFDLEPIREKAAAHRIWRRVPNVLKIIPNKIRRNEKDPIYSFKDTKILNLFEPIELERGPRQLHRQTFSCKDKCNSIVSNFTQISFCLKFYI